MIDALCKLLGIREDQAEDALKSERAARHALSRRSFFGAAGMLTAGTVFSFGSPTVDEFPYLFKAGTGSTLTSFDALLKQHYLNTDVEKLTHAREPLFRILEVDQRRGTFTVA